VQRLLPALPQQRRQQQQLLPALTIFQTSPLLAAACSWAQSKWLIAFGQIMGSVLFLLSGAAGMLEQANPGHL
jgi:hypothetical protein